MNFSIRMSDLPLRRELLGLLALTSIITTAVFTIAYLGFSPPLDHALLAREAWIALAAGIFSTLFAFALVARVAPHLLRRLASIAEAANRIAVGDVSKISLDGWAKDEIGALARAFNVMVGELSRCRASMIIWSTPKSAARALG